VNRRLGPLLALITRDPASGGELIVTRLESPESGVVIEGAFSLGWIAQLTPEQLEFVGAFLRTRGNVQKLAAESGVAYNTARSRLDEIVRALGVPVEPEDTAVRSETLDLLASGEIEFDEAMRRLKG
jgi:hypothetical protein